MKTEKSFNSEISDCLNDAINDKCDSDMSGENTLKQNKPFICDTCGKIFKYNSQFIIHCRTHTNSKPFICNICSKGFVCQSQLNKHSIVHSDEKPYVCGICLCSFKYKKCLHCKKHVGIKNYKCNVCEKTFFSKASLIQHQVTHSEMRYVCKICYKSFKSKYYLKYHELEHSDKKMFKCEFCSKGLKSKKGKLYHVRMHTGEKPYACNFCPKSYTSLQSVRIHEVSHSNEVKEQKCAKCNKTFHRARLKMHIEKCKGPEVTDPKKQPVYKCATCNKTYKSFYSFKKHTENHSNPKSRNYIYAVHKNINLT